MVERRRYEVYDELVCMIREGTKYFYHQAALDTATEITDSSGDMLEQYSYDVYGTPIIKDRAGRTLGVSAIGNRFMFQGRDRDPAPGLYNFRHRYYSPGLGRFVQVDPIRQAGGFNLYTAFNNRPSRCTDPRGLFDPSETYRRHRCEQMEAEIMRAKAWLSHEIYGSQADFNLRFYLAMWWALGCDDFGDPPWAPEPAPVPVTPQHEPVCQFRLLPQPQPQFPVYVPLCPV